MKKPKAKKRDPILDYSECAKYISEKLGRDIRDYAGKFADKANYKSDDSVPYQDFWHWICDVCDVHDGGTIMLDSGMLDYDGIEPWQAEILKAFIEEFGDYQEYLTSW